MSTETKPQHTPGPWHYVSRSLDYRISGESQEVCRIHAVGNPLSPTDPEVLRANARLIAAAPDLLVALKSARDIIVAMTKSIDENLPTGEGAPDVVLRPPLTAIDVTIASAERK